MLFEGVRVKKSWGTRNAERGAGPCTTAAEKGSQRSSVGEGAVLACCLDASPSGMLHRCPLGMSWHAHIDMGQQQPMWATRAAVVELVIVIGRRSKPTVERVLLLLIVALGCPGETVEGCISRMKTRSPLGEGKT